jgi:hypothetical protein
MRFATLVSNPHPPWPFLNQMPFKFSLFLQPQEKSSFFQKSAKKKNFCEKHHSLSIHFKQLFAVFFISSHCSWHCVKIKVKAAVQSISKVSLKRDIFEWFYFYFPLEPLPLDH